MAMATAGGLLLPRLHHSPSPSSSSCVSSTATSPPHSASTCIAFLPTSSSCACSLTSLRTTRGVGILRATDSESAAPAPVEETDGPNLPCDLCNSKGWLVCDFCKGQKTNVQVRTNKFYRRCPSCRAAGVVICPQCKVFKCVSFPDGVDGY